MAIYPGAKKKLIGKWNKVKITRYRRVNLHVAVSNSSSLHGMFSRSNSACSHFYVNDAGIVEQYIDTKYRSASDMNGNDSTISVETEGGVNNVNGEKWTSAQVKALTELWIWLRDTHGIADRVATGTHSNAASEGLSWHRLGVQGNFGGRKGILSTSYKPGGIMYSSARGKECPGDAKILQIPGIHAAGRGKVVPVASPKPKAKPKKKVEHKAINSQPTDFKDLLIDGKFEAMSVEAFQILMRAVGFYSRAVDGHPGYYTDLALQKWLKSLGFYKRALDGKAGYHTIVALQKFLRKKGFYTKAYLLDGDFGPATVKAFQKYLNSQNG
ncbi:peptidoglycan recognition protein family protein [Glutamicibacter arilaitensis]|uniref:peptidoglycan recognition protein family protein n=1 Tax=Glutamicibacter arilaitensis TaxID=256701 RepID=UPI003F8DB5FF